MCGGVLMEYCCFVTASDDDDGEQRNTHGWIMKARDKHDGVEYGVREGQQSCYFDGKHTWTYLETWTLLATYSSYIVILGHEHAYAWLNIFT